MKINTLLLCTALIITHSSHSMDNPPQHELSQQLYKKIEKVLFSNSSTNELKKLIPNKKVANDLSSEQKNRLLDKCKEHLRSLTSNFYSKHHIYMCLVLTIILEYRLLGINMIMTCLALAVISFAFVTDEACIESLTNSTNKIINIFKKIKHARLLTKQKYLEKIFCNNECCICYEKNALNGNIPCKLKHPNAAICDNCLRNINICPLCRGNLIV